MKVLYVRHNQNRKEKFRLMTAFVSNGTSLLVHKIAFPSSLQFLRSFYNKYKLLSSYHLPFQILKPNIVDNRVIFKYINGENLLNRMYRSVQQRDYKDIDELFKFYLEEIINKLDQIKKPPIINKEFNNIFGHHLNEETAWIKPGILDLNLDNFTINRKIIYNIDYEWTWNFPIPRDFVIFRGLYSLLDAIQSQGLDPSYIEDRIFSKYYKEQYLLAEDSFQNYINLTTSNRSSLSRIPKNIFSYSETPDLTERLTFLHNLERKTVEQQEELTSLRNQNEQLSEILSKNKHIIKVSQKTGLTKVINSLQKIKGKLSE